MNVRDIPRSADDYAGVALIDAATLLLAKRKSAIPDDFLAKLFGLVVPEDLARYTADELAGIAERSWSFLGERKAGTPKIRFEPAAASRDVSILEIVNDDMPFLVDSVVGEINHRGLDIRLFVHPVFIVERNDAGALVNFRASRTVGGQRESFIHIHVDGVEDAAQRAEIVRALEAILADVRVCVQDWQPALARARSVIADLRTNPPPLPVEEIAEAIQFLEWIVDDNFTLLGARDYRFADDTEALEPEFETGLGLLRSPETRLLRRGNALVTTSPEMVEFLKEPKLLIVTKAAVRSRVHRRAHLDYIGVKRFDGAARSTASSAAPVSTRRAIPARRWSTCSKPIRATSCSRSTRRRSINSRSPSSSSTSARACACCPGATVSTVSSRCSSTFRASATTATSGRRSAIFWSALTKDA